MRIRCPKCSSVNTHPADLGWRKIECPTCFHPFVASKLLAVSDDSPAESVPAAARPAATLSARNAPRTAALAVAAAALLAAGFFARTWLVAKYELQKLRMELSDMEQVDGPSAESTSTEEHPAGDASAHKVRERMKADRVLLEFQEALVQEMQSVIVAREARLKMLETKVERGERALAREKDAHGKTKRKLDAFLKENMALRREVAARSREIDALQRSIERGR